MLLEGILPGKDESSGEADAPAGDDDDAKRKDRKRRAPRTNRQPRVPENVVVVSKVVIPEEVLELMPEGELTAQEVAHLTPARLAVAERREKQPAA